MLLFNSTRTVILELLHMSDLKDCSLTNAVKVIPVNALLFCYENGVTGIFLPDDIPFDGATAVAEN